MSKISYIILTIAVIVSAFVGFKISEAYQKNKIADLSEKLATFGETIEIEKNLYAKKVAEIKDLNSIIDGIAGLKKQLENSKAELLVHQKLAIKWKKAYEAILKATQVDVDPTSPGVVRKRIDFAGKLGPINATGYTLTDPPEAFLKLEQVTPLVVTVSVAQNKDGSWSSLATSSDDNVSIDIELAGVNPLILSPKWYQRIWVGASASPIGDTSAGIQIGYFGDKYSLGATCSASINGYKSCGGTFGFRLFK